MILDAPVVAAVAPDHRFAARSSLGLDEPAVGTLHALDLGLRGQVALAWRAGSPSSATARAFVSLARGSV